MKISQVTGREIFDSRGLPTVECEIVLEEKKSEQMVSLIASVPSGLSKGKHEALELRDGDKRLAGKGVSKAIENLETKIAPILLGKEPDVISMDMKIIEADGTENKSHLGANATLAASLAILKAQALVNGLKPYELVAALCEFESVSLPVPMFNIINGGVHADNSIDFQEFLLIPSGQSNFRSAIEAAATIFYKLKELLEKRGLQKCIGDEGGFAPQLKNEQEALDLIMEAIAQVENIEGNFSLGIDVAASRLYDSKTQLYTIGNKTYNRQQLISFYEELSTKYPISYIEDGFSEDDWEGWKELNQAMGKNLQIVGDDIFATNINQIGKGIKENIANAVLIKPNQIGTVTETLQAILTAKEHGLDTIISHRSGETNDNIIVDLAIGTQTMQIKAGGLTRGERLAKYNHLLRIEDRLTMMFIENEIISPL